MTCPRTIVNSSHTFCWLRRQLNCGVHRGCRGKEFQAQGTGQIDSQARTQAGGEGCDTGKTDRCQKNSKGCAGQAVGCRQENPRKKHDPKGGTKERCPPEKGQNYRGKVTGSSEGQALCREITETRSGKTSGSRRRQTAQCRNFWTEPSAAASPAAKNHRQSIHGHENRTT